MPPKKDMACADCNNLLGITCGDPTIGEKQFRVVITPETMKCAFIPCDKRDPFEHHDGTEAELVTPEGLTFIALIADDNCQTYLYGPGWIDLLRRYSVSKGDVIRFKIPISPSRIEVALLCPDSATPLYPINGIAYHHMDATTKDLVDSLVWSRGTHLDIAEMDQISCILQAQGPGVTRPWVHVLRHQDISRMRISPSVGTECLPELGRIKLVRFFMEPSPMIGFKIDTGFKITPGDNRIEIKGGWELFLLNNKDVKAGTLALFTVHMQPQLTMFIKPIVRSRGPCIKCQIGSGTLRR